MRIVIPGGSGQVGTLLARAFHADGHDVCVLSRRPENRPWSTVGWNGETLGDWTKVIDGADVIINLAGRSVNCRYDAANRHEIMRSRVNSTRAIGAAIAGAWHPPRVWLQASTATIYAHRYDAANDEATGLIGGAEKDAPDTWRFSIEVARAWEDAARGIPTPRTRLVLMRSAMTMSPDRGGIFDTLRGLTRRGFGGQAGDGRQFISWIHEADFIRAIHWLIERESFTGAVNLAAPAPLPNVEFMRILRDACGMPVGLPASEWMLEIGARVLGTETELILKSRRVVPRRLLDSGFKFRFPEWNEAARDLCQLSRISVR